MGNRGDYARRETKKPRKDTKKVPKITILEAPPAVEIIRKGKKHKEAEEE